MNDRRDPPSLIVTLDLEQPPISLVVCGTWEDEQRLRVALSRPATRRRILQVIADALEALVERQAA